MRILEDTFKPFLHHQGRGKVYILHIITAAISQRPDGFKIRGRPKATVQNRVVWAEKTGIVCAL